MSRHGDLVDTEHASSREMAKQYITVRVLDKAK